MSEILIPLNTCERELDALRRYTERDRAIERLAAEIEQVRSRLLRDLYGGRPQPQIAPVAPASESEPASADDERDPLLVESHLLEDRIELGAEDEPTTREAEHLVGEEFRRLARELRSSWDAVTEPPRLRDNHPLGRDRAA